jgi:hypothetical protein
MANSNNFTPWDTYGPEEVRRRFNQMDLLGWQH